MDRAGLIGFIKGKLGQGPLDNQGDVAIKVYFYDVAPALISPAQWDEFISAKDHITLKKGKRLPLLQALADNLPAIAKEIGGQDDHVTLIIYGIVTHSGKVLDLFAHLDQPVTIGRLKSYRLKAG